MTKLERIVTVHRDGFHNAFTDLIFWKGCYWVSYRKGATHMSMDSCAVIACSADRTRFREVAHLKVPGDVRDPKMLLAGPDRLAVIFPSYPDGVDRRTDVPLQQYICFSNDGSRFDEPRPILPASRWLWRARPFLNRFYGVTYGEQFDMPLSTHDFACTSELVVSDDLIHWDVISQIGRTEMSLGETGMHFMPDGELWTVTRRNVAPLTALLAIAKPPYTKWEYHELNTNIEAPTILEHNGALYVSGRCNLVREGRTDHPHAEPEGLAIWRLERGRVTPVLRLPAAGDCSYPGLIKDPEGRICISYYSQHAYMDGVLGIPNFPDEIRKDHRGVPLRPADIYFAELSLDETPAV